VPPADVERMVEGIDHAFDAYDAHAAGAPTARTEPWYVPFRPGPGYEVGFGRQWSRDGGGVLAGDSPRVLFDVLATMQATGLTDVVAEFLGEHPALSWKKSVLRRVGNHTDASWHQDGAFLGADIRSINVWTALTHCGDTAPGLDIVARRLDHVVATGTPGAIFSWSASTDEVASAAGDVPVWRPVFEPGDVLLFDHLMMHRTACDDSMTRERYATEMWCFAPSVYPDAQIPLVI
jgi:hypothetical protein